MTATELPSAIPAVSSGSVAASSEPKTSSSTTSAAAAPKPTLLTLALARRLRDLALDARPGRRRRRPPWRVSTKLLGLARW